MDEGDSSGKSAYLGELIDEFGDILVADLLETYTVNLSDVFRPGSGLTPSVVLSLIANLPVGSRFYAERRGGQQFRGWTEDRYALAAIVNAVRSLQYTYVVSKSKSKPAAPKPFPVPDRPVSPGVKPGSFAAMAAAHLTQQQEVG